MLSESVTYEEEETLPSTSILCVRTMLDDDLTDLIPHVNTSDSITHRGHGREWAIP